MKPIDARREHRDLVAATVVEDRGECGTWMMFTAAQAMHGGLLRALQGRGRRIVAVEGCTAVANATDVWLRQVPFTPQCVLQALHEQGKGGR